MSSSKQRPRKRKRRGTQGGTIKPAKRSRGQARASGGSRGSRPTAAQRREQRLDRPPSWRSAIGRAVGAAVLLFIAYYLLSKKLTNAITLGLGAVILYVPAFYYFDSFAYHRRQRQKQREREKPSED